MLAARASRNAVSTRNLTRWASLPTISSRGSRNFSYSPQHAKAKDGSDPSNPFPETRTLDRYLGKEKVAKVKPLGDFLRKAQRELTVLYGQHRRLKHVMKGPYKVRTSAMKAGPSKNPVVKVEDDKVTVDGVRIPNIWLRDNCQCASCMHDATKQRLLDTFSLPQDIAIKSHSFSVEGSNEAVLSLEWSDGHTSTYPCSLLQQTVQPEEDKAIQRQGLSPVFLWDATIASNPPTGTYYSTVNDSILGLLRRLRKYGFCFVRDTPFDDPIHTQKLLEKIAFIRETHYGGFYDFTADLASKDTAYTNIALEAHTDTTYFSDPAGLQAFHLLSHTDGEGGASLLVDGFKVADELLQTDKKAYEILSTVNVHGHASGNDGISIQPYRGFPVLEHDVATGDLLRVRWNSSDRASIEMPIDQVETWYDAARKFDALLKKKENEYWEQLVPGKVLIFDNWRVLHGRSSFTGKRRICGGYVNRDDWISKFKMQEFGQDAVLKGLAVN